MAAKLSKQELKEPDRFQVMLSRVMIFLAENRKKLYAAGAVITALIIAAGAWFLYDLNMQKSAHQLYASVQQAASEDKAAAALREVLEKYPRSRAAMLAHYRLAGLSYSKRDFDAAIRHYEAFLQKIADASDLKTIALMGLGYAHEGKKDYKGALAAFEKAAASKAGPHFAGLNDQNMARIYEAMNERARALEHYRKALSATPDPLSEMLIKRRIAALS